MIAESFFFLSKVDLTINATPAAPAIPHPIGPKSPNKAAPPPIPAPPAAIAPPPSHANAALAAAAPPKDDIAAPVLAVPNVVAIAIAAAGPPTATAPPATAAPIILASAALPDSTFTACGAFSKSQASLIASAYSKERLVPFRILSGQLLNFETYASKA